MALNMRQLARVLEEDPGRIPEPSPAGPECDLTVGIATYDDFDGAWFTIASLLLHHADALAGAEILLLDNHPEAPTSAALKALDAKVPGLRYLPVTTVRSTAVRDLLFRHARGQVVLVLDSHVLLAPGGLAALRGYFAERPDCRDLVQGPLLADDATSLVGTHCDPVWRGGMFGVWGTDERGRDRDGAEFDIPSQGLGLFACRREAWPGLHPKFRSFGGEEGYLHEKVRRGGGRTVCLPALAWMHRFERPAGIPYPYRWEDRMRNNILAWTELGWDVEQVQEHYRAHLGTSTADRFRARIDAELAHPASGFDGVIHPGPRAGDRETELLEVIALPEVPATTPAQRTVLTHRLAVDYALLHGWRSALILQPGKQIPAIGPEPEAQITAVTRSDGTLIAIGYAPGTLAKVMEQLPSDSAEAAAWAATHTDLASWLRGGTHGLTVAWRTLRIPTAADLWHNPPTWAGTSDAAETHQTAGGAMTSNPVVAVESEGAATVPGPRRAPGLEAHDVADGVVVYHPVAGIVHHLNPVAAAVFELSDGRPRAEAAAELADVFGLSAAQAGEALDAAWWDLTDRSLLIR